MNTEFSPLDVTWMLLCGALVMLMQAGFCCLESGLSRAKNSINVAAKNLIDFVIASLVFWLFGFGLMFGASWMGLIGTSRFAISSEAGPWMLAFLFFQLVFCGTSTTIVSGAVAERMRFAAYLIVSVVISGLIYPVFGHWAWGGSADGVPSGWLARLGFIDFAGSSVVHSVGGWLSLAAVLVIGPRLGRFDRGVSTMHGHNFPLAILGVFLLWFGWFGFNGGSTLAVTKSVPGILLNTNLSAAAGGISALALAWCLLRRPDVSHTMNGCLAGLVAITASCHLMTPGAAVLIGLIAGGLCLAATQLLERIRVDDVVSAVPVHGVCGAWGTLAVALFAPDGSWGSGVTRWQQLGVQALGMAVCFAWTFGLGYVILRLIDHWFRLRTTVEAEEAGLNFAEHGVSTELVDLLDEMKSHREEGDFSIRAHVEPHTEVGQVATQYNRVLDRAHQEIVSREQAVAAARAAEDKYRDFFENAVWGMFQTTPDGRYLAANPALARLYGYDLPGQLIDECDIQQQLYVDPRRRAAFLESIAREGVVTGFESEVYRRDGTTLWISENARMIHAPDGELLYFEGTVEDITRRREAEELQRTTEAAQAANAAKGNFLAHMSHEIRTPLNGILGTLELMRSTALDENQDRYLRICHSSADSLLNLLNDILDFSKIEAGKLELVIAPFEPRLLLEDVVEMFASRAQSQGLELACSIAPDVPATLYGDADRLRQVLANLTNNAIKFTAQGNVVVRATVESQETVTSQEEDLVTLRIEVADTGIGIPEDQLDRLFQAFTQVDASTTRRYGGSGLGLAISKQFVELMGGHVEVQSQTGVGSRFAFTVSLKPATDVSVTPSSPNTLAGRRVLVVDPNQATREIMAEQLHEWGMSGLCAESAAEALSLLRRESASGNPIWVAMLDHHLADADALDFAAEIRRDSALSKTFVVLLTTLGQSLTDEDRTRHGLAASLTKPIRQSQLFDTFQDLVSRDGTFVHRSLSSQEIEATSEADSRNPRSMHGARILLAEDNEVNQIVAREILEREGYEVQVVGNGREAVTEASTTPYALLLIDCQMPEMDGFEATRLIRQLEADGMLPERQERLAILALTANAYDSDRRRCTAAGMDGHLSKPIDRRALLAAVAKHTKGRLPPKSQRFCKPKPDIATSAGDGSPGSAPRADARNDCEKVACATDVEPLPVMKFDVDELLTRCLDDVELARRVLGKFQNQLTSHMEALARRLAARCWDDAARMAHGLIGSAGNLALSTLAQSAARLETACRDGDESVVKRHWAALQEQSTWCLALNPEEVRRGVSCKS